MLVLRVLERKGFGLFQKDIFSFTCTTDKYIKKLVGFTQVKTKTQKNNYFTVSGNYFQPLHKTTTFTILTNSTIFYNPIYFLSTLTISTSHTNNILFIHFFLTNLSFYKQYVESLLNTFLLNRQIFYLRRGNLFQNPIHTYLKTYPVLLLVKKVVHTPTSQNKQIWLAFNQTKSKQRLFLYFNLILPIKCIVLYIIQPTVHYKYSRETQILGHNFCGTRTRIS